MANQKASATLKIKDAAGRYNVEVLEENRRRQNVSEITDTFEPYQVHLYKMTPAR
jgi:hypothetical protein